MENTEKENNKAIKQVIQEHLESINRGNIQTWDPNKNYSDGHKPQAD